MDIKKATAHCSSCKTSYILERAAYGRLVAKPASSNTSSSKVTDATISTSKSVPAVTAEKSKVSKKTQTRIKVFIARILVLILLAGGLYAGSFWAEEIEDYVNHTILQNNGGIERVYASDTDNTSMSVHFIDVGQADAIVVRFPDNRIMIVDSGDNTTASRNALKTYLDTYIFSDTNKTINWFQLTHSDADHVGGAAVIFDNYEVQTVYRPATFTLDEHNKIHAGQPIHGKTFTGGYYTLHATAGYRTFVEKYIAEGSDIYFHQDVPAVQTFGEVTMNYYAPQDFYYGTKNITTYNNNERNTAKADSNRSSSAQAINSQSPYVVLTYKNKRIMLTGDATDRNEEEWLARNLTYNIDVLKVQHHGSLDGNNAEFFSNILSHASTSTVYAVFCVGVNTYNHPSPTVIQRLKNAGLHENSIMTTLDNGNILANINASGQLYFGTDIPTTPTDPITPTPPVTPQEQEPEFWLEYWHIAVTLFVLVTLLLFTNEIVKLKKSK